MDAHNLKKRKMDRPEDQEPPPESGRAGDLDFISALPDDPLCTIISLLPTKDGARTQALARRWRPLWRSAPLNLVGDGLSGQERKRVVYISKILAEHPGPALRLSLPSFRERHQDKIDRWLRSQALTGLQELSFDYHPAGFPWYQLPTTPPPQIPQSALRFAPTLRVASISYCYFPKLPAQSLNFPHLKQLSMYRVTISGHALHSLLSGCLSLESLLLKDNVGVGRLRISSSTLRSIGFSAPSLIVASRIQELIIEDAPCLERLLPLTPDYGPSTVQIIRAPKLQMTVLLSNGTSKLHIGTMVFQEMPAINVTTIMHTVKFLVIDSVGPDLDAVISFLKCFPCLERLYIISHLRKGMKNARKYDPLDPVECLTLHLKTVVLQNYWGNKPDVDFAKFFILNAMVLEQMIFRTLNSCNDKWMSDQHRRLQVDNRASPDARFEFKRCHNDSWCCFPDSKHIHDLSVSNPFADRFENNFF
ncbi:putative FBD-associated F-box protein At5g56440 [Hordeum vulgare subsp. vulgare]|uniref:putative FBD-associated F-box protein At5g56440 n=1 Tax=Hordeum vulgare subsp. vulgare TaxID=112509 RepID=UPI001D1A3F6B|nr:putative FBD-associated F-box protein At5g56440 [Hordeum vulgare subsp. vulgare]